MSRSFTLIFETSTPRASIAVVADGQLSEQREFTGDRSHNAILFAPLKQLLDGIGTEPIGLVLVGSGPGSYSGTRVGLAAAQGVAIARGCPAVAVPSILAVPSARGGASCLAIGDARRGSFWTARIEGNQLLSEPILTDEAGLLAVVAQAIAENFSVFTFEDPSRFPLPSELQNQVRLEFPDATRLWEAWTGSPLEVRRLWENAVPQPLYLKPPHITPATRPWLLPQG
jgi:tRNA threonylcarbamoyladenosine biosynthesis protein TsaB